MFSKLRQQLRHQFDEAQRRSGNLFYVDIDKEKIWELYLAGFSDELRQSNNCNCCRSFLRQYGGLVSIVDNKVISIWDFEVNDECKEEYGASIKALKQYVHSLPVHGIFLNPFPKCGTDRNPDKVRNVIWEHFYVELPAKYIVKEIGPKEGEARANRDVLKRSFEELTDDAVTTVLELIEQGSIYRGTEFKKMVKDFQELKKSYKEIPLALRDNFCWVASGKISSSVSRIRNSAIGTFLVNLSEGMELNAAVRAFENVVAPANYKRPTALVTPRMIDNAKARLEELGLVNSLNRRMLSERDLSAQNAIYVHRPQAAATDIFTDLKKDKATNPRTLSKIEEVSIDDFVNKVLPTAKSVKALLENSHLDQLVSLVGPQDPDTPTLFKYDNNFSWSYVGEAADSIKQRVKNAGGVVNGVVRISLSWHNLDDLDLHVVEADGHEIYYGNKRVKSKCGGTLDVDMNAGYGTSREPVENVFYTQPPTRDGVYRVFVRQFSRRESTGKGFEVEIELDGETHSFSFPENGLTNKDTAVASFEYTKDKGFKMLTDSGSSKASSYPSKEKWGVKTGFFHPVKAITLSPNHWTTSAGHKHFFFLLEGCKAEEKVRGFYNEFLSDNLSQDRKVFELLGDKVIVAPVEDELSGIGFSETVSNHLFVEVESSFKRVLKVTF